MSDDNVFKLIQPETLTDRLTEVLRDGAGQLLTQAVEAEVSEFLAATADLKGGDGCRRVVRHSHLPERDILTGIGPSGRDITMRVIDFYLHHEGLIRENWVPIDIIDIL